MSTHEERLISHRINHESLAKVIENKTQAISAAGDKPYQSVEMQLSLLNQLAEFELGRFLLLNKGINGYWTHYILTYPMHRDSLTPAPLEKFLLERAPVVLATQERFKLFLAENQKSVANGQHLATIPCGMMGELLYLNYTGIDHIKLTGIDYDEATLGDAKHLASQQHLLPFTDFLQKDAWHLGIQNQFDLISSNGLNIYEADDEKVYELYKQFYIALKPGGKLVTSYLTPPPVISNHCEWNLTQVNQEDLLMQKIIFADIVGTNWQHFRSTETTRNQLIKAGFTEINIIPDKANIFPTVTAIK